MEEGLAVDRMIEDSLEGAHAQPDKPTRHRHVAAVATRTADVLDLASHISREPSVAVIQATRSTAPQVRSKQVRSEHGNRAINIALAALALLVLSPLLVVIALAINSPRAARFSTPKSESASISAG
jgi:hypothetical protein